MIGSTLYEMNWEFLICMLYPSYILFCFVYLMRQIGGEEWRRVAQSCNVLLFYSGLFTTSTGYLCIITVCSYMVLLILKYDI